MLSVQAVRDFVKSLGRRLQLIGSEMQDKHVTVCLSNDRGRIELTLTNSFSPRVLAFKLYLKAKDSEKIELVEWDALEEFVHFPIAWGKDDCRAVRDTITPLADTALRAYADQKVRTQQQSRSGA